MRIYGRWVIPLAANPSPLESMAMIFANNGHERISRVWAMPNPDTFSVPPIGDFVKRYLSQSKVSVDPFARNKRWATYTNDLNPDTRAEHHMKASDFLAMLVEQKVNADLIIFDPPYSLRQVKEVYLGNEFVIGDLRFDIASGKMLQTVLSGWLANHEAVEHSVHLTGCTCRASEPPTDMMLIDPACPVHGTASR